MEIEMRSTGRPVLLAALAMALSIPAVAQQQMQPGQMMRPGMQGGQGMMPGYGMRGHMMGSGSMMDGMDGRMMGHGYMMGGPGMHVEGRLAFMKTELGITDAQQGVWNTYADAVRASAGSMQQMHDMMMSGNWPASLPERMEFHEEMMAARLEALRTLRKVAVPLYEALDEQQKRVADTIMGMGMGMM